MAAKHDHHALNGCRGRRSKVTLDVGEQPFLCFERLSPRKES